MALRSFFIGVLCLFSLTISASPLVIEELTSGDFSEQRSYSISSFNQMYKTIPVEDFKLSAECPTKEEMIEKFSTAAQQWFLEKLQGKHPEVRFIHARDGEKSVGFLIFSTHENDCLRFEYLVVRSEYWNQGVMKKLVANACSMFPDQTKLQWETRHVNKGAIDIYLQWKPKDIPPYDPNHSPEQFRAFELDLAHTAPKNLRS